MNWPNRLTILRLFLVLPFIGLLIVPIANNVKTFDYHQYYKYLWIWISSAIIFIIAMITDFLDGYLARRNNQISVFGKLFDPIADKFLTTSAFIFLTIYNIVPVWITVIFILRDIYVDGTRNLSASNNVKISASIWGKAKTMMQSIGIPILFFISPITGVDISKDCILPISLYHNLILVPIYIAAILSIIGAIHYTKAITHLIKI